MSLSFRQLCIEDTDDVCRLLNDTAIRRHLPLASMAGSFSVEFVQQWIARSRAHWQEHGYGIWQIERDGEFIGWGGCQVFNGEREFVLVVQRRAMGAGLSLLKQVLEYALGEFGAGSMLVVLPLSRPGSRLLKRVGFTDEQTVRISGCDFIQYRHPFLCEESLA
ncbi:GNAT family N-acetyltransferase [Aestuariibacter sp. GS-14]|uniref:GNAT family N-acetyltransferase n=1 Tax=Aestuariibacter sp. GS-14 TaxID=2590670 RepID=UPI00112B68AC|nr:GNAT family N-acetyltransferase [Aestuariibacter sp. GS-14]TPV56793.1 GNAT family N-acetyltransferase [Aestuariibacter sp. GS-14]